MADTHDTEPESDPDRDFRDGDGDDEEEEILPMSSILSLSVESAGVKIEVTADGLDAQDALADLVALALETSSKLRRQIQ